MSHMWYVLDDQSNPVLADITAAGKLLMDGERRSLARDMIGDITISTVFLCLDHRILGDGPPLLWETMIFGGKHDGYMERYATRDAALLGHYRATWIALRCFDHDSEAQLAMAQTLIKRWKNVLRELAK